MQNNIIGSMATFPGRYHILEKVVTHIAPQFSRLYIYLNDYKTIPSFLARFSNVVPILGIKAVGDISANGKMYFLTEEKKGIAFTLDDDFIYPPDYVQNFLQTFDKFSGKACLCVHGSLYPDKPSYYYERQLTYAARTENRYNAIVNMVGSGTAAFPISLYHEEKYNFTGDVFVDLNISLHALAHNIPIISIVRKQEWLKPIKIQGLWEKNKTVITHHTHILHANSNYIHWEYLRKLWYSFLESQNISLEKAMQRFNLAPESIDFLQGRSPLSTIMIIPQLAKLTEFAKNLAS